MAKRLTATEIIETLLAFASGQSIAPQTAGTSDVNGTAVQLDGEPAIVTFNFGTSSATTAWTPSVEESANGSSGWGAAAAAELLGGGVFPEITTANDVASYSRFYIGGANYIRAKLVDDAAGTPSLLVSATVLRCRPLAFLKPYEIDQVMDELSRRSFERGGGDLPTIQEYLASIIT